MNSFEIRNGINHLIKKDRNLKRIIVSAPICSIKPKKSYFIALTRAIIGQQLSLKAANSINQKFLAFFNNHPTPEKILVTSVQALREKGLSTSKIKYLKDLSLKLQSKEVTLNGISLKSTEEIVNELTKIKGIGFWTVDMFLIFTLGRLNVLPVGDLGLKRAIMLNYSLEELPDENLVREIANKYNWDPYCSIASWYLWKSLEM